MDNMENEMEIGVYVVYIMRSPCGERQSRPRPIYTAPNWQEPHTRFFLKGAEPFVRFYVRHIPSLNTSCSFFALVQRLAFYDLALRAKN